MKQATPDTTHSTLIFRVRLPIGQANSLAGLLAPVARKVGGTLNLNDDRVAGDHRLSTGRRKAV